MCVHVCVSECVYVKVHYKGGRTKGTGYKANEIQVLPYKDTSFHHARF